MHERIQSSHPDIDDEPPVCPRQRPDGRWEYAAPDFPVGYCQAVELVEAAIRGVVSAGLTGESDVADALARIDAHRDKYHADGHATADEAAECYRRFLADNE